MENNDQPYVIEDTENFSVVFKPPKTHSVPVKSKNDSNNLFDWYKSRSRFVFDIMHRLDYETHGLILFAKNERSFHYFKSLQNEGGFVKEYSARVSVMELKEKFTDDSQNGFPLAPSVLEVPFAIESYFRPYGPGRKLVRPVIDDKKKHKEIAKDNGGFYRTEITGVNGNIFTVRLKRGFRHQIRCHLCWIGFPIINDPMYPKPCESSFSDILALRSHSLFFTDPASGEHKEYRIPPLH